MSKHPGSKWWGWGWGGGGDIGRPEDRHPSRVREQLLGNRLRHWPQAGLGAQRKDVRNGREWTDLGSNSYAQTVITGEA